MTGIYYTEKILPHYCEAVIRIREKYGKGLLQEDGDPSLAKKGLNRQRHDIEPKEALSA